MCNDRRVDDQQHPRHCKKKCTSYVTLFIAADEEENQAFGYHLLLDEIIMASKRRIEDEEVAFVIWSSGEQECAGVAS